MYIEASLDGHYLNTNTVGPCGEPKVYEELTWFINKKRLKRLRTSTGHIRVNFYTLVGPNERKTVGFLMLSLKSAQIQTDKHPQVTEAWHKLLGTKVSRPEWLLSYSIRSATILPQIAPIVTAPTEQGELRCRGDSVDITPQLFSEQGIIQIGSASIGTNVFLLTVVVGEASHLHLLLPKNRSSQDDGENKFHFCYTVCGYAINTKNFSLNENLNTIAPAKEKITIRIRSSLCVLKMYFNRQSELPFLMMSGDKEVASTSIDLKTLVPTDSIEDFCSKYACDEGGLVRKSQCYFTSAKTQLVPVGEDGSKPSVEVILMFKYVDTQVDPTVELAIDGSRTYTLLKHQSTGEIAKEGEMLQQLCTNSFSAPQFVDNPQSSQHSTSSFTELSETQQSCSSDKPVKDNQEAVSQEVPVTYLLLQHNTFQPENMCSEAKSMPCEEKKNVKSQPQEIVHKHLGFGDRNLSQSLHDVARSTVADCNDALHHYDLNITLESVQFSRMFPEMKTFFKFYQANAEVVCARHTEVPVCSAGEEVPLESVSCRLGIHSTPSQISHLLLMSPPRISMCSRTTDEQTLVLASTALDSAPLLSADKKECCYWKILRNISTGQQVAIVKVSLVLEDVGMQLTTGDNNGRKLAEYNMGMMTSNEMAVFKEVEELKEWKEKQQDIFKAELLEKETAHLAHLTDEWNMKKAEIEAALKNEADRCSNVADVLEHARDNLHLSREKITEQEEEMRLLKEKLQFEWAQKLQELEELGAKMEYDVDKESQWQMEKADFEQTVTTLQQELELWKETVKQKAAELEEVKKSRLTDEHIKYLCQELKLIEQKLQTALKVKSFYKEQWTRVAKELLHIKTQNRDALHINIRKIDRNQLKNLGVTVSHQETESAKKCDQNVLKEAEEKINKSCLTLSNHQDSRNPTTESSQNESSIISLAPKASDNRLTNKKSKKELEDKLQSMTAERDALLCTGNYSVDDAIIEKLNKDICGLLAVLKD